MNYLQELLINLRQEIPYQWRIQSKTKDKSKAICSAYIDARDVMNVLDKYCTYGWQTDVRELAGFIFYGIGIQIPRTETEPASTLWRWDTGNRIETNIADQMYEQAGKSSASDSLKRSAVQWGIGRFLYDLDTVLLPCDGYNVVDDRGGKVYNLTTHINNIKNKKLIPTNNETATPTPVFENKLTPEGFDAMVKYITEGKIKEVEQGIKKYSLTLQQKTVLTNMINQEKSKLVTAAVKKK